MKKGDKVRYTGSNRPWLKDYAYGLIRETSSYNGSHEVDWYDKSGLYADSCWIAPSALELVSQYDIILQGLSDQRDALQKEIEKIDHAINAVKGLSK